MVRNIEKVIHFVVCWTLWLTGMFYYVRKQWTGCNSGGGPQKGPPLGRRVTGHYTEETLKRQTPLKIKLDRLAFYAKLQIYFILILYIPMIIKYLIVIPLDSELFKEYRYLDCFLFGRFYFYGRTDRANKYIAVMGVSCALIYRLCFAKFIKNDFKYYALEFLFRGYHGALLNESKYRHYNGHLLTKTINLNKRNNSQPLMDSGHWNLNEYQNKTELLYLIEDSSYLFERSSRFYIRPNRSSQSWLRLAKFLLIVFVFYATIITSWTLMLYVIHTPSVITNLGYELSYPNCIDWIGRQSNPLEYGFIHDMSGNQSEYIRTAKNLPFVLPFGNFIHFSSFHQYRIIFEMFDNHLIAWDMLYSFSVHASVVFLIAYDLYLNKQQIGLELIALIGQISCRKQQSWLDESHRRTKLTIPTTFRLNHRQEQSSNSKIIELQAILVDHFNLISKYNHYISFHCRFVICIWVAYTTIVCVWISMVDDSSLKLELTVGEMIVIGLVFGNLTGASFVKKNNIKLYHLIATIMALDDNFTTKMRWTTILQFYYPKPMYCISLFSSIEVSFLFCLKLVSWVATALLVYVSFLFLYNQ